MDLQPLLDRIAAERLQVTRRAADADRSSQKRRATTLHGQASGLSTAERIVADFMKESPPSVPAMDLQDENDDDYVPHHERVEPGGPWVIRLGTGFYAGHGSGLLRLAKRYPQKGGADHDASLMADNFDPAAVVITLSEALG